MHTLAVTANKLPYPKTWFVISTIVIAIIVSAMIYLAFDSLETFARYFWIAVAVLVGVPLFLLNIPPIFTDHYQGEKGLRLRMGLLMNSTVPYEWIIGVTDASVKFGSVRIGIGVKYVPKLKTVFVTSSFNDLVTLHLDGPRNLGGIMRPDVEKITLSVKDKEHFVSSVKARAGIVEEE
ncbi:MAG: hypothetical protein IH630_00325 [Thermoplasmata archaeon]|nr:hypothetical protein [Thermoplasmata archaeon]MCJ7561829.1 hypothetical protein [Thermoplasmata archaeon]TFG67084.1 MAG: hypothetical protein E4H25_07960 [Methanomassiliicoccus sp.]